MSSFVGIDISARKFDLVIREAGRNLPAEQFLQTTDGHVQAIKQLLLIRPQIIVMEATGIYYLDLAVALVDAGLPVAIINPKSSHHFAESLC